MKRWLWLAAAAMLWAAPAQAHPGLSRQIDELSAEVRAHSGDAALRLRRAELYRELEHFDDAARDLKAVARLDPQSLPLRLQRGLLHAARGKLARAERDLTAYLDRGGTHYSAYVTRGTIRADAGRMEGARADFDAALAVHKTPDVYLARGRADVALGELERAAQGYAQAVEELGGYTLTMALIDVHRRRGKPALALERLDTLLATTPDQPRWLTLRADLLDESGAPELAAADRLRALCHADARLAARATPLRRLDRARVYLAIGLREYAIADLERVAAAAPNLRDTGPLLRLAKELPS